MGEGAAGKGKGREVAMGMKVGKYSGDGAERDMERRRLVKGQTRGRQRGTHTKRGREAGSLMFLKRPA